MPIIPVTWEVEIEGLLFKASLGKELARPYLKEQAGQWWHAS
jgi:hypothetical protein